MTRDEFYDWRKKERKIDFLADYRTVRMYFCKKYGYTQAEIELVWKLHSLGKFIHKDLHIIKGTFGWGFVDMIQLFLSNGTVDVWRERKPTEGQNYKIYQLSRKTKEMVSKFYKTLCGEIPIPESTKANPIMKRETYTDKVYSNAILEFNKRMAEMRE